MIVVDSYGRLFRVPVDSRYHPYSARPRSKMAPTPIERPIQLYDIRRRHFVLLLHDQMPIYYDLHARNPSSAPYRTVKVSAYPPALQAKLDKKELHHRRLVALFSIPQFFAVVREGWGEAFRTKNHSSADASSPPADRKNATQAAPNNTL